MDNTIFFFDNRVSDGESLMLNSAVYNGILTNSAPVIQLSRILSFAEKADYSFGASAQSLTTADLNGDGRLDIVTSNSYYKTVSVLFNNGDGFATAVVYAVGESPRSVAAADVNGDGYTDLVIANNSNNSVSVLLNNGADIFTEHKEYALGGYSQSFAVADLNGDGNADIVDIINAYNSSYYASRPFLSILLNNGAGVFPADPDYYAIGSSQSMVVEDFNGDGFADIVLQNNGYDPNGLFSVWLNNGDGTFAPTTSSPFGSSVSYSTTLAASDVNGDGKADILMAGRDYSKNSAVVSIFLNNGDGTFAPKTDYAYTTNSNSSSSAVTTTDLNGDGDADIILTSIDYSTNTSTLSVLLNNGDGTFEESTEYKTGGLTSAITLADLNSDGVADIVTTGSDSTGSFVSVLQNTSKHVPTAFIEHTPVSVFDHIFISDPDGDASWNGGSLVVQITSNADIVDNLSLATQNSGSNGIWLDADGDKLMAGSLQIGTASALSVSSSNAWTLTFNEQATNALVESVGRAIMFNNSSATLASDAQRGMTLTVSDNEGASATLVETVVIAPSLSSATPADDATAVAVDSNIVLTFNKAVVAGTGSIVISSSSGNSLALDVTDSSQVTFTGSTLTINPSSDLQAGNVYHVEMSGGVIKDLAGVAYAGISDATTLNFATVAHKFNSNGQPLEHYSGHTYQYTSNGLLSWEQAEAEAIVHGGHLVTVNDAEENQWLSSVFGTSGIWIGFNDLQHEGQWVWADGSDVTYTNWGAGEPNNQESSDFGSIAAYSGGMWSDQPLYSQLYGIIEYPSLIIVPTLTAFRGVAGTTSEDTETKITFADLLAGGDAADTDGVVEAFVVKSPNGTLRIGSDAATATLWDAFANNTIDATHHAWWTPAANANGTLDAFGVVARDNDGAESITPVNVTVAVTPVKDAPIILLPSVVAFAPPVDYSTQSPWRVATADLDGDGDNDMVVLNFSAVSVLLNNGDGTFAANNEYQTEYFLDALTIADLNNDGHADIVTSGSSYYGINSKVSVLFGKGNGFFTTRTDYFLANSSASITSADFNSDGKADLAVTNDVGISLLLNKGDATFAQGTDYPTGESVRAVASADFNSDGKADLVVANYLGISVLLNNGDGTFAPKRDYAPDVAPDSLTVADLDGDGKTDIIAVNQSNKTVALLLNNGDGTFAPKREYATSFDPLAVTTGDFNGDGKSDFVVTGQEKSNTGGGIVSLFLNDGNGAFTLRTNFSIAEGLSSVTTADLNGDGKADIVVGDSSNSKLFVLLNSSGKNTEFSEQTPVPVLGDSIINDPDGDPDWNAGSLQIQITANADAADTLSIASADPGKNGIWLESNSNRLMAGSTWIGTADAASISSGTAWKLTFNELATNELVQRVGRAIMFNNSSDTPSTDERSMTLTLSDNRGGSTTLVRQVSVTPVNDAPTVSAIINPVATTAEDTAVEITFASLQAKGNAADIDGFVDGFVVQHISSGSLKIGADAASATLYNAQTNNKIDATHHAWWSAEHNANGTLNAFTVVAHDNGGKESATGVQVTVSVTPVQDAPVLSFQRTTTLSFAENVNYLVGYNSTELRTTDFNGDGKADLVLRNPAGFSVQLNNGDGTFAPTNNYATDFSPASVTTADLNGDSKADLIISYTNNDRPGSSVAVLIGKGDGTFAPKTEYSLGYYTYPSSPSAIVTADVNGDGQTDLIVTGLNSFDNTGQLSVFLNNGDGTFLSKTDYATPNSAPLVTVTDLNGDGNADLIVTSNTYNYYSNTSTFSVLMNNGDGTFAPKKDYSIDTFLKAVTTVDLHGDGKADIIVTHNNSYYYNLSTFSVFLNKGDGTFAPKTDYTLQGSLNALTTVDLNGDGKTDLIVTSTDSYNNISKFSVFLNNTDGTFTPKTDYTLEGSLNTVTDLNGDGKADIIVTNGFWDSYNYISKVSVFLNNGDGSFAPKTDYTIEGSLSTVEDLNGDGNADLIVTSMNYSNTTSKVSVLMNNGDGTFTTQQGRAITTKIQSVTVNDLNDDGDADIIVMGINYATNNNNVSVMLNTSHHTAFTEQTPVAAFGNIIITDPDGEGEWKDGSLSVQITANADPADSLSITTTNPGGNGIWLDVNGDKLMAGLLQIGTASAASVSNGTEWIFSLNEQATNELMQSLGRAIMFKNSGDIPSTNERSMTLTVSDSYGASTIQVQQLNVTPVNDAPTFTHFTSPVTTTAEDTAVEITVADLLATGKSADVDGVVDGFVVQNLSSGTLKIGSDKASATPYNEGNHTIDAAHHAWWTPETNANGTLNAFTTVARDNDGGTSATALQATVVVTPVNDAPVITVPQLFASTVAYAVAGEPNLVITADSNGDGHADIISTSGSHYYSANGIVSVLQNNGDGTFAPQTDYATEGAFASLTSADINGDGNADLIGIRVVGCYYDSRFVSVLLSKGDGTFAPKTDFVLDGTYNSVKTADLNGDNNADIIIMSMDTSSNIGKVSVLLSKGDGTFAPKADYATDGFLDLDAVITADLNGDRKADLIIMSKDTSGSASKVSLWLGKGDGTFAPATDYAIDGSLTTATTADLNGDGKADMIVTSLDFARTISKVSVLLNNGDGTFAQKTDYAYATNLNSYSPSLTTTDLNGDGKADLLVSAADYSGNISNVSVFLNNGDGTFAPKTDYVIGDYGVNPSSVLALDLNGDGYKDILYKISDGQEADRVVALLNNGKGGFDDKTIVTPGGYLSLLTPADLNNDGKTDIIGASTDASSGISKVSVLLNTTPPPITFTEHTPLLLFKNITITEPDGPAAWSQSLFTVQITANADTADHLTLPTTNPGNSGIWLDTHGNMLMAGTITIGSADAPSVSGDTLWHFIFNENATNELVQNVGHALLFNNDSDTLSAAERGITLTVSDSEGASARVSVAITQVNDVPKFTAFTNSVATTSEDIAVAITFADLQAKGNSADNDGSIDSFTVKGIASGTLTIGHDASTATVWNAATNNTIDANHNAWWMPYSNANGSLDAFTVVAHDNDGGESVTEVQAIVAVTPVNDAPAFISYPVTVASTYTEHGNAVVLDSNVLIVDAELSTSNNYASAALTLARHGGASADDLFSGAGIVAAAASGIVTMPGTDIGTYTWASGTLTLLFNTNATPELVNSAMQSLAYENASDTPPPSVQIDWTFNDGNSSEALGATASTMVLITDETQAGRAQDGYLAHALVWIDSNNNGERDWTDTNSNGLWESGEGEAWTLTDSTGQFANLPGNGTLRIAANPSGGTTDISTGLPFTGSFSAPSGSTVINPLTTLLVAAGGDATMVNKALGLDSALNLATYDPLAALSASGTSSADQAQALAIQGKALQIANIMDIAISAVHGAGATNANMSDMATRIAASLLADAGTGSVNLDNSAVIANAMASAAQTVVGDTTALNAQKTAIADATALINNKIGTASKSSDLSGSITNMVAARIVAQETLASQAAQAIQHNSSTYLTLDSGNIDRAIGAATSQVGTIHPPAITNFSPLDGATDVPVDSDLHFTFTDAIQPGSGLIEIHRDSATGPLVERYDPLHSDNLTISGNELTVNPTNDLDYNSHYYVTFAQNSIDNLIGDHFTGSADYDLFTVADPYAGNDGHDNSTQEVLLGIAGLGLLAWLL